MNKKGRTKNKSTDITGKREVSIKRLDLVQWVARGSLYV